MDIILLVLITALIGVISLILYTRKNSKNESGKRQIKEIPGFNKSESKTRDGVVVFGEFSSFLKDLHKRFGLIASFYQDDVYAVSIADAELMKPLRHLEITAVEMLKNFEIFWGREAFGYQDIEEIRRRRRLYDHHFMLKACKSYTDCFVEIADEYVTKWKKLNKDDQIPLMKTCLEATFKCILRTHYGDYFKDEEGFQHFKKLFSDVIKLLEEELKPNTKEELETKKYATEIREIIKKILISREKDVNNDNKNLFIDVLLEESINIDAQIADSILFIMAGYEVTGKAIMWAVYHLAAQPELQEKLYKELKLVLQDDHLTLTTLSKLQFLGQVVDEIIRFRLDTIFTSRLIPEDLRVGDYVIPANARLYMHFGMIWHDKRYFANAEKFDPEHFSPENSKARYVYSWKPFGFAGKRQCPGQSYARTIISTFLAKWIRQFRFKLVPDQNLKFVQGIVLRPESDIWAKLEPRI